MELEQAFDVYWINKWMNELRAVRGFDFCSRLKSYMESLVTWHWPVQLFVVQSQNKPDTGLNAEVLEVSSPLNTNAIWLPLIYGNIFMAKPTQSISPQPFYLVVSAQWRNTWEVNHSTPHALCQMVARYLLREWNIYRSPRWGEVDKHSDLFLSVRVKTLGRSRTIRHPQLMENQDKCGQNWFRVSRCQDERQNSRRINPVTTALS